MARGLKLLAIGVTDPDRSTTPTRKTKAECDKTYFRRVYTSSVGGHSAEAQAKTEACSVS